MTLHPIARLLFTTEAPSPAPPRRELLRYRAEGIPSELAAHPHWLVAGPSGQPIRTRATGNSKKNPEHWTDFVTASRVASEHPEHYPYMVLTGTGITAFDVDRKAREADESDAAFSFRLQRAEKQLERLRELFPNRYEERSKSGNGFHIFIFGNFLGPGGEGSGEWKKAEIYTRDHGIAMTGHVIEGSAVPHHYPPEEVQAIRDEMKGGEPSEDRVESRSNGKIRPEWARCVIAKIAVDHPRPDRGDWLKITSATCEGVGTETGIEILSEVWPEEEPGEYRRLVSSLKTLIPWGTLRAYKVDPDDPMDLISSMPHLPAHLPGAAAPKGRKPLSAYLVTHTETLGMSWHEIDALRPPYIIEGFLRWGEVLLLGAESKSRKSWLTQDAGFSVAAGVPWLADEHGRNGFATAKARVHVLDLELNDSEMRFRFAKARGNRFPSADDAAAMTAMISSYSLDGENVATILPLLEELKATVRPGELVIVDCLYRLCPDGNEVAQLASILEILKRFASETKAGVILVDHFRKAGDDKARNRFAGSFVKQASASTLVAIEVTAADVLVLNIDARTFHGCKVAHARFDEESYTFRRVLESEVEQARQGAKLAEAEGWLLTLWKSRPHESPATATDAVERWRVSRQAATPRLGKLVLRGWISETKGGSGKATEWTLTPEGIAALKGDL